MNLGDVLQAHREFDQALSHFVRATDIFSSINDAFSIENAAKGRLRIEAVQKLIAERDERLAIARGDREAKSTDEWLDAAVYASVHEQRLVALRAFDQIFRAHPESAEDLDKFYRYNAACCAATLGCDMCSDAKTLSPKMRAELRARALTLSRADLASWRAASDVDDAGRDRAITRLKFTQQDIDFEGVRDEQPLQTLPAAEADAWRVYWLDVADLIAKCEAKR
jgi:hypothetical protein